MIQQTSLKAYKEIKADGTLGTKEKEVLEAFKTRGDSTDLEITHWLGYDDPNKVRPRRHALVYKHHLLEKKGTKLQYNNKTAIVWGTKNEQRPLQIDDEKCCKCGRMVSKKDLHNDGCLFCCKIT